MASPSDFDRLDLIEALVEVYGEVIERLAEQGATWVQFDEPCFVEDRSEKELDALRLAYEELCKVHERPRIVRQDLLRPRRRRLRRAPRPADRGRRPRLHRFRPRGRLDLGEMVHEHGGRHNAEFVADQGGLERQVALRRDRRRAQRLDQPSRALARRCSTACATADQAARRLDQLLPAPRPDRSGRRASRRSDADLDDEMRSWMAFAVQKVGEVATLAKGMAEGREAIADELDANDRARDSRRESHRTRNPRSAPGSTLTRRGARRARARSRSASEAQRARLDLPLFPATTIGSYPADRRDPPDPHGAAARARSTGTTYEERDAGRDRAGDPLPGGDRPRRPRARRARAQRHGPVLRRADGGLRLHAERLGAVLRLALRAPADHLRRRQPAVADDRRLDHLRPVAHREAGQGHAHRPGDDARVVVRPRRPAARGRPASSSRWRSATRSRTSRRRASRSSRSTSRRSARACRCAGTAGTST